MAKFKKVKSIIDKRTKMVMEIDYLFGRVNELFELYDEGEMNEVKAHKLFTDCCENFLGGKDERD